MRAWNDEVTKTRIVFSRKSVPAAADATQYLGPAITNFGLEPGFHVAARLEASATTSVAAPVTAVIEYNYERNGQIVLPAGSRAIGRINSADAHGNMAITFDSVDLPNGSTVPISAVAVDTNLRSLKGQVTGSSRGKAMLVATLSGIGQTTAMMLGNNTSTALSGAGHDAIAALAKHGKHRRHPDCQDDLERENRRHAGCRHRALHGVYQGGAPTELNSTVALGNQFWPLSPFHRHCLDDRRLLEMFCSPSCASVFAAVGSARGGLVMKKSGKPSGMLHQIGSTKTPKQKTISELVREMDEREAEEIAQLRAQALQSVGTRRRNPQGRAGR